MKNLVFILALGLSSAGHAQQVEKLELQPYLLSLTGIRLTKNGDCVSDPLLSVNLAKSLGLKDENFLGRFLVLIFPARAGKDSRMVQIEGESGGGTHTLDIQFFTDDEGIRALKKAWTGFSIHDVTDSKRIFAITQDPDCVPYDGSIHVVTNFTKQVLGPESMKAN